MSLISRLNKKRYRKGFLLVEVLLTILILSVGLTAVISSYVAAWRATIYSSDYSFATLLLSNTMSNLLQRRFIEAGLNETGVFAEPYEKFGYTLTTHTIADGNETGLLNEVAVTVSWASGAKEKNITATTYLFNIPQRKNSRRRSP